MHSEEIQNLKKVKKSRKNQRACEWREKITYSGLITYNEASDLQQRPRANNKTCKFLGSFTQCLKFQVMSPFDSKSAQNLKFQTLLECL